MRRLGNRMFSSRQDSNHASIVKDLRLLGYQVIETKALGGGFPDLIVCRNGKSAFLEIKAKDGVLNQKQCDFHMAWQGPTIAVVRTTEQAIIAVMKQWSTKK